MMRMFKLADSYKTKTHGTPRPASLVRHLTRVGHDPEDPGRFESRDRVARW
jgi:hypothetical protein